MSLPEKCYSETSGGPDSTFPGTMNLMERRTRGAGKVERAITAAIGGLPHRTWLSIPELAAIAYPVRRGPGGKFKPTQLAVVRRVVARLKERGLAVTEFVAREREVIHSKRGATWVRPQNMPASKPRNEWDWDDEHERVWDERNIVRTWTDRQNVPELRVGRPRTAEEVAFDKRDLAALTASLHATINGPVSEPTEVAVYRAFADIRDRKLYAPTHPTFEAYLLSKYGMSLAAFEVMEQALGFAPFPPEEPTVRGKLDFPETPAVIEL